MRSLVALLFFLAFCHAGVGQSVPVPSGVKVEEIATWDVARLNKILTTELKEFTSYEVTYPEAQYPVKLYKVTYSSVIPEQENRPTIATGLVAIPQIKAETLPVVSYQHGTVFSKNEVPSQPENSMETRLMVAQFAGSGYIVIAPDYFGKGDSTETDSYLVKASTQQACLDFLKAAQAVSAHLGKTWGPLFVTGWSQGGWATNAFLNKLEQVGIPVEAASTAAAPVDVYAITNGWIFAPRALDASYIPGVFCLHLHSFERYYRLPGLAEAAIRPEYRKAAEDLYLNKIGWEEAAKTLPTKSSELFNESFLARNAPESARYWALMNDTQSYRWRSATPQRTYYGESDEVIPMAICQLPVGFQKSVGGAETTAHNAGAEATHRGAYVYAVGQQRQWFDELLKAKAAAATEAKR